MEKTNSITVCLFGATGLVGGEILNLLELDQRVTSVKVVTRVPLTSQAFNKTKNIIADFASIEKYKDKLKADVYICCLGTTLKKAGSEEAFRKVDLDYVLSIAEIAEFVKAKKFQVISAMGANSKSRIFYNRTKGQMEEGVSKLNIDEVDIFRPSLLLGKRQEKRFGESIAQSLAPLFSRLLFGSLKKYRPVQASVVARVMFDNVFKLTPGRFIFKSEQIQSLYNLGSLQKPDQ